MSLLKPGTYHLEALATVNKDGFTVLTILAPDGKVLAKLMGTEANWKGAYAVAGMCLTIGLSSEHRD